MIFLLSLVVATLGILPLFMPAAYRVRRSIIAATGMLFFLIALLIYWLALPSLAYPLGGGGVILVVLFTALSAVMQRSRRLAMVPAGIVLLVALYAFFSTSAFFHARRYATLIGRITDRQSIAHWSQDIEPIDPKHIRLVPEETAIALAATALNQNATGSAQVSIGSQYNIDNEHITLQKVRGRLVYAIPLDYRGLGAYTSTAGIPGFITVDAEDPQAKPVYVEKTLMRYSPGAFFGRSLERHLYTHGYWNRILTDYSFELDDDNNPHWVITVCEPSIGYGGAVVLGVAIVDPATGDIAFKSVADVPQWVDRVYPADLIKEYLDDWGNYQLGWWNAIWSHLNCRVTESVTLNYGTGDRCYYVTPMTSTNSDASMTDLIYTDTRTGTSKRYIVSGTTEDNLVNAVSTKLAYQRLKGNKVIYENVFGRMTAIISVLGEDGSYRGAAFVDVANKSILAYDISPLNALHMYQTLLSQAGGQLATDNAGSLRTVTAAITRLNFEQTQTGLQLDIYIDSIPHAFYVSCSQFIKGPFARPADVVTLSYFDSPSAGISVSGFDDKDVHITLSDNQNFVKRANRNAGDTAAKADTVTR